MRYLVVAISGVLFASSAYSASFSILDYSCKYGARKSKPTCVAEGQICVPQPTAGAEAVCQNTLQVHCKNGFTFTEDDARAFPALNDMFVGSGPTRQGDQPAAAIEVEDAIDMATRAPFAGTFESELFVFETLANGPVHRYVGSCEITQQSLR